MTMVQPDMFKTKLLVLNNITPSTVDIIRYGTVCQIFRMIGTSKVQNRIILLFLSFLLVFMFLNFLMFTFFFVNDLQKISTSRGRIYHDARAVIQLIGFQPSRRPSLG